MQQEHIKAIVEEQVAANPAQAFGDGLTRKDRRKLKSINRRVAKIDAKIAKLNKAA